MKSRHILFIGDGNHYFIRKLVERLKELESDLNISILSLSYPLIDHPYDVVHDLSFKKKIPLIFRMKGINSLFISSIRAWTLRSHLKSNNYSHIHIQYVYPWIHFGLFAITTRLNIISTVWGSDYLRVTSAFKKYLIKKVLDKSKIITVASSDLKEGLSSITSSKKIQVVRFGLDLIDEIKKIQKNQILYQKNSLNIVIGYNSHPAQQHIEIINSLSRIRKDLQKRISVILPLTYGPRNEDYFNRIQLLLEKTSFNYRIIKNFLSEEELAKLKHQCDIMLQLQLTDQFSGSMQEHIYAGNLVITGSWLNYNDLIKKNVFFKSVNSIFEVGYLLEQIIDSNEYELSNEVKANNRLAIYELSSWKSNIDKWYELYT